MPIYSIGVAGEAQKNPDGRPRADEIRRCRAGEPVSLIREPANRYDRNAIRIDSARHVCIGYIPRDTAEWLAPRIDNGKGVSAIIQSINQKSGTRNVGVTLSLATNGEDPATDSQTAQGGNSAAGKGLIPRLFSLFR